MTTENVKAILIKAINDEQYQELFLSDPGKALEGYELTEEEASALKNLEREQYNAMAVELEDRVSRAGLSFDFKDGTTADFLQMKNK